MQCKFISNGLAISYDHVLKPCCIWKYDNDWKTHHHISNQSVINWHQHPDIAAQRQLLESDQWPTFCYYCEKVESQNRVDSTRGNGNQAWAHYGPDDITLEIRPGNTCNFACQTCWPEASSRVAQYHHQAKLIDIKDLDSRSITDFDFLLPIADRIRDVILLGGEPFYDKSCKKFLSWAQQHLTANLTIFTNGSIVDLDFLTSYCGTVSLVFSLDAVGTPAEYIRYGTHWPTVLENFQTARSLTNVKTSVNITCSVYNYYYLSELIDFLCKDWPEMVTFGVPNEPWFLESVMPVEKRGVVIDRLNHAIINIFKASIEQDQKNNAIKALKSIVNNLKSLPWDQEKYRKFQSNTRALDQAKNINIADYCEFVWEFLK